MRYRYGWEPMYAAAVGRRGPQSDAAMRASDAERNEVSDRLSHHFAQGRLDATEFKERLDTAMGATTRGDLDGLFDDLPPLASESTPTKRPRRHRLLPIAFLAVLVAVAASTTWWSFHLPWLLILVGGAFIWHRGGHRHRHHRHDHLGRGSGDYDVIG